MRVFKERYDEIAFVAGELPLGRGGGVENQNARLALETFTDAQRVQRVLTRGMRALIAALAFAHILWEITIM